MEQKNSTHVRRIIGHLRYDTEKELNIINSLYRSELRLYKNFFQPVMKLKEKIRDKGKVHRKYDTPLTPYQRIMESEKIHRLFEIYEEKQGGGKASPSKKQTPQVVAKSYIFNDRTTPASVT